MKLNDNDIVSWYIEPEDGTEAQGGACSVGVARAMWRQAYPEWSDEQIEMDLFKHLRSNDDPN